MYHFGDRINPPLMVPSGFDNIFGDYYRYNNCIIFLGRQVPILDPLLSRSRADKNNSVTNIQL